ncbi:uncharacterized protein LOC122624023 [Drosophila teissieri]|uniref:uncharacterized protein LOC122624023 n=1 Tax=Drosophila teissieri TaxID=7243 RepID=UPI001CBA3D28|nr:uncharacterized protein LOC122624023 [Drosophila teissieri]
MARLRGQAVRAGNAFYLSTSAEFPLATWQWIDIAPAEQQIPLLLLQTVGHHPSVNGYKLLQTVSQLARLRHNLNSGIVTLSQQMNLENSSEDAEDPDAGCSWLASPTHACLYIKYDFLSNNRNPKSLMDAQPRQTTEQKGGAATSDG